MLRGFAPRAVKCEAKRISKMRVVASYFQNYFAQGLHGSLHHLTSATPILAESRVAYTQPSNNLEGKRMNIYDAAKILSLVGEITPKEVKTAYIDACKKYHPDRNPAGQEMMKIVNEAFEVLKDYSGSIKEEQSDYGDLLNDALNAVLGLADLTIEICGAWVWITGDTRTHNKCLKESGFYWASKKKAWYFRPENFRSRSRGKTSLEQIRKKYGSVTPQRKTNHMLGKTA